MDALQNSGCIVHMYLIPTNLLQYVRVHIYYTGYSREGYFWISFYRNPLYTLQQYLDFRFWK
jgi:hypothetical protein